ncbi:MAG: DUF4469 domain-containing protein [Bacteroides sp.]|nr:DUF4469 domain-containing protein [Bacteroides sp.]
MPNNDIKHVLNAQLADNTVTVDDTDDKIFVLVSAGTADKQRVISEMMARNPGLERVTIEAVVNLEQEVTKDLLLMGYSVNNGLYQAVAQFKDLAKGMAFDPARNSVYVSFTQGKELREAINKTTVNVVGEKGSAMFVAGGTDTATRTEGFNATAGRNFTLTGKNIKMAGTDPAVGITLKDAKGTVTKITEDMWAVNDPKKLTFIIPAGLADGTYTLTVTTQYGGTSPLKTPRSVVKTLTLGKAPEGGSTGGSGGDDDQEENPLG